MKALIQSPPLIFVLTSALCMLLAPQAEAFALSPAQSGNTDAPPAPALLSLAKPKPEPWGNHFSLTEVTPGGRKVRLEETRLHVADLRSRLVIERISTVPESIAVRSAESEFKEHFGVKVEVRRPSKDNSRRCKSTLAVPGLNRTGSKETKNVAGCPSEPTTENVDVDIPAGAKYEVDTSLLQHGDQVLVRLLGQTIGERTVTSKEGCKDQKVAIPNGRQTTPEERTVCPAADVEVGGQPVVFTLLVVDYTRIRPYEKRDEERWDPLIVHGERIDVQHGVSVSAQHPSEEPMFPALKDRGLFAVTAEARKGDEDPRTVTCPLNAGLPTCTGFKDGERVTIVVSRPLTIDGKEVVEEINRFVLEAAGLGLHYLPVGDRRAYYSTASMVAVEWEGSTPGFTFAQTIGYSLYWKHRTATWVEGISAGAHFAVLGNSADMTNEKEAPVSFGIGGQLGLGQDAFQVGGGYDVLTQRPYFTIGIGIPDAVKLGDRLRKRNNGK